MSMHDDAGHSRARAGPAGLFRRRVIFEITSEQLPLLDAAEARHGSKRAALLAALQAEQRVDELQAALAKAEKKAGSDQKAKERRGAQQRKDHARLERQLKAGEKKLVDAEAKLATVGQETSKSAADHQARLAQL